MNLVLVSHGTKDTWVGLRILRGILIVGYRKYRDLGCRIVVVGGRARYRCWRVGYKISKMGQ